MDCVTHVLHGMCGRGIGAENDETVHKGTAKLPYVTICCIDSSMNSLNESSCCRTRPFSSK